MRRLRAMCPRGVTNWFRETTSVSTEGTEEAELSKDRDTLRYLLIGGGLLCVAVGTAVVCIPQIRRRYFGQEGSYLVRVETHGRPSLGGPFSLVRGDGVPVTQATYLGKWAMFYFGFTHCPEICPVELNRMGHAISEVRRWLAERRGLPPSSANEQFAESEDDIVPLFISCDPKRDSIAAVNEYLRSFHPSFVGLVGTPAQVAETCRSYRVYYSLPSSDGEDYLIDHSIAIFLFDPQGRFVDFFGSRYNEFEIAERIKGYMEKYEKDPTWTNY